MRHEPDLTLDELRNRLIDERQIKVGMGLVWRFFDRHGISFKKTVHAAEQDGPDVAAARAAWKAEQPNLDASRLVFIHETGTATMLAAEYATLPKPVRAEINGFFNANEAWLAAVLEEGRRTGIVRSAGSAGGGPRCSLPRWRAP